MTVSAWLILSAAAKSSSEEDEDWEDWTCQQCSDGAIGVGNYYIQRQVQNCPFPSLIRVVADTLCLSRAQIAEQGQHLLANTALCEAHPSPSGCRADWPQFWAGMGPFVWRAHFSYLCDDRKEECGPVQKNDYGNLTVS